MTLVADLIVSMFRHHARSRCLPDEDARAAGAPPLIVVFSSFSRHSSFFHRFLITHRFLSARPCFPNPSPPPAKDERLLSRHFSHITSRALSWQPPQPLQWWLRRCQRSPVDDRGVSETMMEGSLLRWPQVVAGDLHVATGDILYADRDGVCRVTQTHTQTHTHAHTDTQTNTQTHTNTHTHTHAHMHTHKCTHTNAHTCTHRHTH